MKIAVWLNKDYRPEMGGGFSYQNKLIEAIDNYTFDSTVEICFVTENSELSYPMSKPVIKLFFRYSKSYILLYYRILMEFPKIGKQYKNRFNNRLLLEKSNAYSQILNDSGIKIIYYLTQVEYQVYNFPFITTNWDIGHCSTFAFPELIYSSNFEWRNNFYTQVLPKALMVFCESEAGKQELVQYTNIDERKIKVVPIFAGNCVSVRVNTESQKEILRKYGLENGKYFFYPAQFWAHKNHIGILNAFVDFLVKYPDYKMVFTGVDCGNLNYVKSFFSQLGLEKNILFLGFVPIEQINTFYCNTVSLVMATYLGPTNMPVIEAMELGCPVICSDLAGHREILGDAAIYFNPMSHKELTDSMLNMVENRVYYYELIKKQRAISKFRIDYALEKINNYLQEVVIIRNMWE